MMNTVINEATNRAASKTVENTLATLKRHKTLGV